MVEGVAVTEISRVLFVIFVDIAYASIVAGSEVASGVKVVVVIRIGFIVGVFLVGTAADAVLLAIVTATTPVFTIWRCRIAIIVSSIIIVFTHHRLLIIVVAAHEASKGGACLLVTASVTLSQTAKKTL